MTTKQRRKQAQQNGAKAAGTKTPEGTAKSALNSLRHGLTSKTLVLQNESRDMFELVRSQHVEKFQPTDPVEMDFVDEMVAAIWRLRRMRTLETALIDFTNGPAVRRNPKDLHPHRPAHSNRHGVRPLGQQLEITCALYPLRDHLPPQLRTRILHAAQNTRAATDTSTITAGSPIARQTHADTNARSELAARRSATSSSTVKNRSPSQAPNSPPANNIREFTKRPGTPTGIRKGTQPWPNSARRIIAPCNSQRSTG